MLVTLYSFGKERNSTAVPDAGVYKRDFDCIIKNPFTFTNPTLIFKLDSIPVEMYCYIPDFDRYYFIESWTFDQNRWIATTSVDVLGSRRDGILATTQYVLRSASKFDSNIADSFYPAKSEYRYKKFTAPDDFWITDPSQYTFVLDIGGSGNFPFLYAFSYSQFYQFSEYLMGNTDWLNLDQITDEISEQLSKMLFNPLEYITSCRIYPIKYDAFIQYTGGTAVNSIPFGWWSIPRSATRIGKGTYKRNITITYDKHPQSGRGNWLNLHPYTSITAFYPPFGSFDIPTDVIYSGSGGQCTFKAASDIDLISGMGSLRIYNAVDTVAVHTSAKVGVDFPLFSMAFDTSTNWATAAVVSGANAYFGDANQSSIKNAHTFDIFGQNLQVPNFSLDSVAGAVKDFVSGFLTASTKIDKFGSAASVADYADDPCFVVKYTLLVDEDKEKNGRPLAKRVVLSTLSGYTTCQNPHLVLVGYTPTENDAVNSYLANGFYIE